MTKTKNKPNYKIDYRRTLLNEPDGCNGAQLTEVPKECTLIDPKQRKIILNNLANKKCEINGLAGHVIPNYLLHGVVESASFSTNNELFTAIININSFHDDEQNKYRKIKKVTIYLPLD